MSLTMSCQKFQHFIALLVALTALHVKDVAGKPPSKIIGGDDTTIEKFPSTVSIRFLNTHRCGGTLITNKHVLTAAHCVILESPSDARYNTVILTRQLKVYTGTNSSSSSDDEHRHEVGGIRVHPDYSNDETDGTTNDIAVITLTKGINPDANSKPIPLAPIEPPKGAVGYIAGWGVTSKGGSLSENLKRLKVVVDDKSACFASAGQMCASRGKGEGPSNADSGGPLYVDNYVAGIIINGYGSDSELPDIYTSVFHYRPWIRSIIFQV